MKPPLSYISKGNFKVSFTDRSLSLKQRIQQDLLRYMLLWNFGDSPLLELVSVKRTKLNNIMYFHNTLNNISSSNYDLDNLNEISRTKVHCNINDQTAISTIGNYIEERTHKLTFNFLERQTDE